MHCPGMLGQPTRLGQWRASQFNHVVSIPSNTQYIYILNIHNILYVYLNICVYVCVYIYMYMYMEKYVDHIISDLLSDRIWSWRYISPKNHRVEIALVVLMLPGLDWSRFKSSQSKYKEPQPKEQYLSFQICSHAFQVISLTKINTPISCPSNRFRKVFQSFFYVIHLILCMIDPTMLWDD